MFTDCPDSGIGVICPREPRPEAPGELPDVEVDLATLDADLATADDDDQDMAEPRSVE